MTDDNGDVLPRPCGVCLDLRPPSAEQVRQAGSATLLGDRRRLRRLPSDGRGWGIRPLLIRDQPAGRTISVVAAPKAAENSLARTLSLGVGRGGDTGQRRGAGSLDSPGWQRFETKNSEAFGQFRGRELPRRRLGTYAEVADIVCCCAHRAVPGSTVRRPVDGEQGHHPHANAARVDGSAW